MTTKLLTSDDVTRIVRRVGLGDLMREAITGIERACQGFDPDRTHVPIRSGFDYTTPHTGLLEWMPALQVGEKIVIKMVGYHPGNPTQYGLPTILSTILLFDTATGRSLAMVDGTFITALRTGAASAVASRVLAQPDSRVLGLIGAGAQAVTQLHALSCDFKFEKILFHDVDAATQDSFPARCAAFDLGGMELEQAPIDQVVARSDILCTATSVEVGAGPVFDAGACRDHLHVNAVGSDFPGKIEVPLSFLRRALVCPDFRGQAVKEGECQQLDGDQIGPELVELVQRADDYHDYRSRPTVFDSTGWALEDYVVVDLLIRHAEATGSGTDVDLESVGADPKDPYGFLQAAALDAAGALRAAGAKSGRR